MSQGATAVRLAIVAALLIAVALAPAGAEQPAQPTQLPVAAPLAVYAMRYVADPALHKELKLSEVQVKKIVDLADRWNAAPASNPVGPDSAHRYRILEKDIADIL